MLKKMNVWTYWENASSNEMYPLALLCWEKLRKICPQAVLVTPENIDEYLPEIKDNDRIKLIPYIAQKVDYLRSCLLAKYGGIWIDIDTIVFKNPYSILEELQKLNKEVFLSYEEKDILQKKYDFVSPAFIVVAKPNNAIMIGWKQECERILKLPHVVQLLHESWACLGGHSLGKSITSHGGSDKIDPLPENSVFWMDDYNIIYSSSNEFLETSAQKCALLMLNGTHMYKKTIPKDSLLYLFLTK